MLKNLYLICGKSGSGKTYVTEKLHNEYGYAILKSYTTRKPRHPSDDDHTYVTLSDYYDAQSDGVIAADTCFDHNFYWSTIEQLNASDLYVIDKAGIEYFNPVVKDWTPECQAIKMLLRFMLTRQKMFVLKT